MKILSKKVKGQTFVVFALFLFCIVNVTDAQQPKNKVPFLKPPEKDHYKKSRQMVLVITKDWNAVQGKLQRYERKGKDWKAVGDAFDIVVGRNGLAWGTGLHENQNQEPNKREGDGKSPAGIFVLSSVFGFAKKEEANWLRLPYTHVIESTECVDDTKSNHYNRIVDKFQVGNFDWDSSEKMLQVGEQYRWGIFVDHNTYPRVKGDGSCIFLHIWANSTTGTSGCTAMESANMDTLLKWLDKNRRPVLVQLPQSEYERLQSKWNFPKQK
jgi:D-alanyl-D-alanine dipeptidase